MNKFSALTGIPDFTKGFVRELRVRWALKELGLPYEPVVYPHPEIKKEPYLKLQPFGQVPYFTDEKVEMFESGAILLHLALKHGKLLPAEEGKRAETLSWFFAGLNSIEPWMLHRFMVKMKGADPELMKSAEEFIRKRVQVISEHLWDKEFFAGESLSIADILMTTIFRELAAEDILKDFPTLIEFKNRFEARPAFKEALAEHERLYEEKK